MRCHNIILLSSSCLLAWTSAFQLSFPDFAKSLKPPDTARPQQEPMEALKDLLPGSSDKQKESQSASDGLSISDVLGKEGRINIFAGFTRDVDTVSQRLDDNSKDTTVLAPLNSAITKLPRKPWEDPAEYETLGSQAYDGSGGEDRAYKNLRRFVEAHVLPLSKWEEGKKVETVAGESIWWESKEGKKIIQPGNVEVSNIADKVAHGEVWVIKGCLNYK